MLAGAVKDASNPRGAALVPFAELPALPDAAENPEVRGKKRPRDLLRSAAAALFLGSLASLATFLPALLPLGLGRGKRGDGRRQHDAQ